MISSSRGLSPNQTAKNLFISLIASAQTLPHPRHPVHLQGEGAPGQHYVCQDRGPPQEGRHHRNGHPSGRLIFFTFFALSYLILEFTFFYFFISR